MLETTPHPPDDSTTRGPLWGKRLVFLGKLGGLNRREAAAVAREQGAIPVDSHHRDVDLVVIGADEQPLANEGLLDVELRESAAAGRLEIITETEFWERLGLFPTQEEQIRKLYTPAMLADLLNVPIGVIRRWHRRGLIVPVREVHRLAYFDFQEIATARRLAQLLSAGASPAAIETKLAQLARWVPDVERPLAQLAIIVEGRDLLLRQGEGLVDASGQRRFDFEASEPHLAAEPDRSHDGESAEAAPEVYSLSDFWTGQSDPRHGKSDLLAQASTLEEEGWLAEAIDMYRTVLAMGGPDAEIHFQMAELLYRGGDITAARERYYSALELDEDYVEARANLGCVLAETGQPELAVAAFQGALSRHRDYPDVHYHLARVLDELDRGSQALEHWHHFLNLAPESPWAAEAKDRLGLDP